MERTEVLKKLRELKPILKEKYGIEEFAIFGSVARDEAREDSDVDIVVFKSKGTYFDLMDAIYFLEEKFKTKVDMGFFNGMKTFIKNRIKKDLVYVWNRKYR